MIPGIVEGFTVVSNAMVWLVGGKRVARVACKISDFREKYIQPTLDRMWGVRPSLVEVVRELDDKDGKIIFAFNDVEAIDYDARNEEIRAEGVARLKAELAAREKELRQITASAPAIELPKEELQTSNPQESSARPTKYNVKLKIKNSDIRLGEIDFSNWEDSNIFEITIASVEGKDLLPTDKDYQKVLDTLRRVNKVTDGYSLKPNDVAKDKIGIAVDLGKGFTWLNRPIDYFKAKWQGKAIRLHAVLDGGQNSKLTEDAYVDSFAELVASKEEDKGMEILSNYYGTIKQHINNELLITQDLRKTLTSDLKSKEYQRRIGKIILVSTVVAGGLAVAGLVALTVFNVAIGLAVASVITGVVGFFGSKIFAGFMSIGVVALVVGIAKGVADYNAEMIEEDKTRLTAAATHERELVSDLLEVEEEKNGAIRAFKAVKEFGLSNNKCLELSVDKKDKPSQTAVGDVGLQVICKYLSGKTGCPSCEQLILSNNKITESGAISLAQLLTAAATNPNLNVKKIDLAGNPISNEGIKAINDSLLKNFTVTDFNYDREYKVDGKPVAVDQAVVNEIDRQLLINRYLCGEDFSSFDTVRRGELFREGETEIIEAAKQKMLGNFTVTSVPFKITENLAREVSGTLRQNQLLPRLLVQQHPVPIDAFIEAFGINPSRCLKFLETNKDGLLPEFQSAIAKTPWVLKNMGTQELKQLLQEFQGQEATINLLASIIEALPAENAVHEEFKEKITATLKKILLNLKQYSDGQQCKDEFEALRKSIADLDADEEIQLREQKESLLRNFSAILYPQLSEPQHKLNSILESPNSPPKDTLERLIAIYLQRVPGDFFVRFTSEAQLARFRSLIRSDIYASDIGAVECTQLQSLDKKTLQALLETFFMDEEDAKSKAILASGMITEIFALQQSDNPIISRLLNENLRWLFFPGKVLGGKTSYHTYASLVEQLETRRKEALRIGESKIAAAIDDSLQAAYQAELIDYPGYRCLRRPFDKTGFEDLKNELGENFNLRKFEFPKDINDDVKNYMMRIINSNMLCETVSVYKEPTKKLEKFLEVYSKISDDVERQQALTDFMAIASNATILLELVKNDINSNNCRVLKDLPETQRIELLMSCLGGDPHACGIATLVAKLMDARDPINAEYLWRIFDYNTYSKWNFEKYIAEIKKLKIKAATDNLALASQLDEIIQAALQEDLISRFPYLSGVQDSPLDVPSSFEKLKGELDSNYDLVKFDFDKLRDLVNPKTKEYIKSICQRNLLKRYVESSDLKSFMAVYGAISPEKRCQELLANLDRLEILKMLTQDLGKETALSCDQLRSLDAGHREILLAHCFALEPGEEQHAPAKAKLISELLNIADLFDAAQKTKLMQEIKKLVYWSMSVSGGSNPFNSRKGVPYYKFEELQKMLDGVLARIPETEASLRAVRAGLANAIAAITEADELVQDDDEDETLVEAQEVFDKSDEDDEDETLVDAPEGIDAIEQDPNEDEEFVAASEQLPEHKPIIPGQQ